MDQGLKISYLNFIESSSFSEDMYKSILKDFIKRSKGEKGERELLEELIKMVEDEIELYKTYDSKEIRKKLLNENKNENGIIREDIKRYIKNKRINNEEIINRYNEHLLEYSIKLNRFPRKNNTNSNLLNGKKPNLSERYRIANNIFDFDKKIRKLNIQDKEKYKLLSIIFDCNETNARLVMNGNYQGKIREEEVNNYLKSLNK